MTNKTNRAIAILLALLLALETVPFFALASETGDGQPDFPAISEEAAPENEQPDKGKDANAGSVLEVYSDPAQVPFEGNAKDEAEETTLIDGDSFITGASLPAGGTLNVQPGDGEALKALLNPAAEPKRGAKQAMKAAAAPSQDETFYQLFEVTVSDGESTFATDDALRLTLASGLSLVKEITADGKAQAVKGTVKDVKVYHFNKDYSEYELISAVEWQYNEDQTAVASVSFETNGLSPFGVVYTVDFSYEKKAGNITVHFDTWQENLDDFDFVSYDKAQGIAELDVIALCESALGETGGKALEAVLSGGASAADFDKAFFSGAAVSVAGKGVEYGKGMILLTDDAAEASVTFTADQAALTVEISGFTLPQKPTVPEQEDGFAYRFLTESATTADILAANQIVSDPCAIVSLSDETLVSVKEDTLTAETWFDEVMLTLSLSDGTEVEIRLSNPAPVKAGETVIVDGVGSFAADKEVLAGTVLIVEADAKAPEGVVIGGEKKRGGPQESDPVFYNITLVGPDGEPVKDTGADVTIATDIPLPQEEGMVTRVTGVKVYHIDEKGSVDELSDVDFTLAEGRISAIRFATPGFSLFAVTYTVDFYNGEAEYHLTGEESMTLSALFAALGIDRSAADAVNVIFSNPELLAVSQTDDGADWILTSLQPFNTTETLTVDFADGDQIVVRVEDAQSYRVTFNVNDPVGGNVYALSTIYGSEIVMNVTDGKIAERPVRPRSADEPTNGHLSATRGYYFVGWLVNGTNVVGYGKTENVAYNDMYYICPEKIEHPQTYTACFAPEGKKIITFATQTVSDDNVGTGTVSYSGTKSFNYIVQSGDYNTTAPVYFCYSGSYSGALATPSANSEFVGWYYDYYDYSRNEWVHELLSTEPLFISDDSLSGPKIATAHFREAGKVTITYKVGAGRVKVVGNESNYVDGNSGGNAGQDTQLIYAGTVPSKATANNTTNNYLFVSWRENDANGKILSTYENYNTELQPTTPAYENKTYYAEYVKFKDNDSNNIGKHYVLLRVNTPEGGTIVRNNIDCTDKRVEVTVEKPDKYYLQETYTAVPSDGYYFDHWEIDGAQAWENTNGNWVESREVNIKDFANNSTEPSNILHQLTAVFKPYTIITYDLSQIQQVGNNTPDWQDWVTYVSPLGNQITKIDDETYRETIQTSSTFTLPELSSQTRITRTKNGYNLLTHSFIGWKAEGDDVNVYPAGTVLTANDSWKYYAVWDAYFPNKNEYHGSGTTVTRFNTNTCGFFVRLFDSVFDKGDTNTYTDCLYTSRLFLSGSGSFANPSVNGARADFYGNSDETNRNTIDIIDAGIRAIGDSWLYSDQQYTNNKYSAFEDTALMLESTFPSDDFIFSRIRQWNLTAPDSRKIQISGHQIPQDMLTSDYFDLKWYVLKDQENSWHIDGMLIPKYAKLRATKQFLGVSDAFAAAKNGYKITVTDGQSDTHVLEMHYSDGAVTWTYTMNGTSCTGTQNGTKWTFTDNGNLLAVVDSSDSGNRLSWVLHHLIPMTAYTVTESGYDSAGYAVTASHVIENTPQTSNLSGGASAAVERVYNYPIYLADTSYQTVAFSNLYTLPWVMTIFKQDGNTLHGLDHVTFDLEVRDSQNTIVSSIPSEYTTTSDGQISVVFPSSAGNYTFRLTEREHEGYNAITTITGAVSVTDQGVVTVSNVQGGVTGEAAMVTVDSSNNAVVYIKNMPERVNVKVEKEWAAGASNRPVTMQLLRNNVPLSGKTIVLGAAPADAAADPGHYTTDWNYTWENLPAYIDGSEVVYSAREEWIGEPGGINSIHYNLDNDPSDGYADYIVYQTQSETVNGNLTTISVKIENTPDSGQVVFTKIDTGNKPVAGATFKVYREQDETKHYAAFTSGLDGVVTIQISDLQSFINDYYSGQSVYGTYWMKETSPVGYVNRYNSWYKLEISANNSKLYYTNDNGATYTILYPAEIENEPFTAHVKVVKEGINHAKLAGAKFALYRTATSLVPIRGYANLVTDQNGEIDLGELPQGTYYLSELAAPEGYQLLTGRIAITVTDDRNAEPHVVTAVLNAENLNVSITSNIYSVTVPNTPAGQMMKLWKKDASSNGDIQNAEFRIYTAYNANDASQCVEYQPNPNHFQSEMNGIWNSTSRTYTTDSLGQIYYGYLPIGTYYVVETAVPMTDAGFAKYEQLSGPVILDVTASQITLTYPNGVPTVYDGNGPANHVDVVIMNTPVGTISVSKTVQVDNADSTELADKTITFGLFTSQPTAQSTTTVTYTMTLGSSATTSEVAFTGLHMGTYWVYELDGSNHPILNGNTITVNGHVYTVSEATPNVTLTNAGDSGTVSITNGRLTGALKITKAVTVNGADDTSNVTNGTYSFSITGVAGTATANEPNHTISITFANGRATSYQIDSNTAQPIATADAVNNTWSVVLENLIPGDYTISETVPSGMSLTITGGKDGTISGNSVTMTVTAGDTTPTATAAQVVFTNDKVVTGQLTVTKYVQLNGTDTVVTESKTFTVGLYKWDATTSNWIPVQHEVSSSQVNWTQTITVAVGSATGTATFSPLDVGEKYRVYELDGSDTIAKDALYQEYKVTYGHDNGVEVTVTDTNKTTTVINNKETTAITATKTWGNGTATPPAETSITWTIKATTDNGATDVTSAVLPAGETADHTVSAPLRTTSWQNLPMGYNGKTVTYTVTETAATYGGYTYTADEIASANSSVNTTIAGTFAFTNPLPTINIPVLKTWADATPAAGDYVKIGLFAADGTTAINQPGTNNPYILTISYDATNNRWPTDPVSFMNLPMYDSTGNAITYTVVETEVKLGGSTLTDPAKITTVYNNGGNKTVTSTAAITTQTFTNTKQFTSYKVRKTWGNGQAAPEGAEIKIKLSATANNAAISEADLLALTGLSSLEVTLNGGTTGGNDMSAAPWEYEWTGLPAYDNAGNGITYSAAETQYKIGTETIEISSGAMVPTYTSGAADQLIAENKIPTTSIVVEKAWSPDGWPSNIQSVTVGLYAKSGTATTFSAYPAANPMTLTITEANSSAENVAERTFSNLPVYDTAGNPITYSVQEIAVTPTSGSAVAVTSGTVTVNGKTWTVSVASPSDGMFTVTNTYTGMSIQVTKVWTKDGAEKTTESQISFALHKVLTASGQTTIDEVDRTGTVRYTQGTGWETVTISNLPITEVRDVTTGEGEGAQTRTVTFDVSYYVVETDAAADAGYVLATTYSNDNGTTTNANGSAVTVNENNAQITIINTETPGVELPATGGPGTALYTAAGITLMLLGALWLLLRRKREQH